MAKTSNPASKIPVTLVTGLLGSGKTTLIQTLLTQKPAGQTWAILINEFGEINIDSALVSEQPLTVEEVNGGCLCCTAQFGYQQALNQLIQQQPDRILIEPTGLGHPAKIIDILKSENYRGRLTLKGNLCLLTPHQLTPQRWEKSKVMRDLITLADAIILNKTDLASEIETKNAFEMLNDVFPPKEKIITRPPLLTDQISNAQWMALLDYQSPPSPLKILVGLDDHLSGSLNNSETMHSLLPECVAFKGQFSDSASVLGWVLNDQAQFNRLKIQDLLNNFNEVLIRAKGVIKTGKEWQSLNWVESQLQLEDIAWRQDSRLVLIFNRNVRSELTSIEKQFEHCLHRS